MNRNGANFRSIIYNDKNIAKITHKDTLLYSSLKTFKDLLLSSGGVFGVYTPEAYQSGNTLNSPFIAQLDDLSGNENHVTLSGFSGTTTSGYDTYNSLPVLVTDDIDDCGLINDSPTLDIQTHPMALCFTGLIANGAGQGYIISRNLNSLATMQYGLYWDGSNLRLLFGGLSRSISISTGTWFNLQVLLKGSSIRYNINGNGWQDSAIVFPTISYRPNMQLFCRSNSEDGSAKDTFIGCKFFHQSIHVGSQCTEANLETFNNFVMQKIGILDPEPTRLFTLTETGIPDTDSSYIWDDRCYWDDDLYWTEEGE